MQEVIMQTKHLLMKKIVLVVVNVFAFALLMLLLVANRCSIRYYHSSAPLVVIVLIPVQLTVLP